MTPEERAELAREEARIAERFTALEAERDRLREQLAAFVPPGALGAGETPALCGTCKDRLCVPGLPGCARCVKAGLAETTHVLAVTGEKADALRGQRDRAEAERDQARAELTEIRQHDETSGGVLYDVIGRAIVRALTPDEAVRAIERRLIQPLVAQRQEARAKARRGRRPDAAVAQAVAQRDAVAVAAEKEWEKHGEEIAGYERAVAELVAERDDYRSRLVATDKAYTEQATRADTAEAERAALTAQRNAVIDLVAVEQNDAAADVQAGGPPAQLDDLTVPVHDVLVALGVITPDQKENDRA